MDVVVKVLTGERHWDPQRGKLMPTLRRMADSELSHILASAARTPESTMDFEYEASAQPGHLPATESILLSSDSEQRLFDAVMRASADDGAVMQLAEEIFRSHEWRPRILAKELGVPVKEVRNRLRRLRRRVADLDWS